jgi:hypothetical protein
VNASTSAKQHCQVRDLSIQNPGAVANCVGLLFKADNVNDINDWHTVRNVTIDGFARGIEVLGRQIWSSYYNVEVTGCTVGINVSTDAATPAFNQNTFTQCQVTGCTAEGVKIVGQNTTIAFYTCNFEVCNTADTLGVAAATGDAAGAAKALAVAFNTEVEQVRSVIKLVDQLEQMQAARNALTETGANLSSGLAAIEANLYEQERAMMLQACLDAQPEKTREALAKRGSRGPGEIA